MGNAKIQGEKSLLVSEVTTKFRESSMFHRCRLPWVEFYQVTNLRKALRDAGIEFQVIKNTLARRATAEAQLTDLDAYLTGPTAIAFSKSDVVAPAKILSEFARKNDKLNLKGAIVEGKVVGPEQIKALAELPSREGMLSMLLSVLQAPVRNFALAVKAVAEQKEAQA